MYKKINYVIPFNKIPLNSCFKHQLITIIKSFKLNEKIYLLNNIFICKKVNNDIKPTLLYFESYKTNYKKIGINIYYRKKDVKDNISYLISCLKREKLIIVACDCYGLSYRKDLYLKKHSIHYVTIYGFDKKRKLFYVVDQNYQNSFEYKKKIVSFSSIDFAIQEYKKNFNQNNNNTMFFVVSKNKNFSLKINLNEFYFNILQNKKKILKGYSCFCQKIDEITNILKKDDYQSIEKNKLFLVQCRSYNEILKYQLWYCLKNKNLFELSTQLIDSYTYIIAILTKYSMTHKHIKDSMERVCNKFEDIKKIEGVIKNELFKS